MAYKLALNTIDFNDYVYAPALDSQPSGNFSLEVEVSFDLVTGGGNTQICWIGTTSASSRLGIGIRYDGRIIYYCRGNVIGSSSFTAVEGITAVLKLEFDSSSSLYSAFYDGALVGTFTNLAPTLNSQGGFYLGTDDSLVFGNDVFTITFCKFIDENTPANNREYVKNTVSEVNDTLFPDILSGNDGVLVNFPTDNSQWVYYDDGGAVSQDLAISSIGSGEVFGMASIQAGGIVLSPVEIDSLEDVREPVLSAGSFVLFAEAIESVEDVPNPTLTVDVIFIGVDGIASSELFGIADIQNLLQEVFPSNIPAQLLIGRPLVSGGDKIVIPVENRENWTKVSNYLKTLNFKGSLEGIILAWLRSEGYEGTWNDAWYAYWEDLGYTKSFPDKWKQWRDE